MLSLLVCLNQPTHRVKADSAPSLVWTDRAPMPTPRMLMGSANLGGLIYAIGGTEDYGTASAAVQAYNPQTNSWVTLAPMLTARISPTVFAAAGKIYAIGGAGTGTDSLSTVEAYDPTANTWASLPNAPVNTYGMAAARASDGETYLFGGYPGCCFNYLANTYRFDPSTNSFVPRASMPLGTQGALAIGAADGKIYLFGGNGSPAVNGRKVFVYEPAANTWTTRQDMPLGVSYASGFQRSDGHIYIFNASDANGSSVTMVYHPQDDTWTVDPSTPRHAILQIATRAENGNFYLFGGGDLDTAWPYEKIGALSEATTNLFDYPVELSDPSIYLIPNADYNMKNPALGDKSKCYSGNGAPETVVMSQLWHAGEDYKGTAETTVTSVGDGTVFYSSKWTGELDKQKKKIYGGTTGYPGGVVIIDHVLPDATHVWSMYAHLDPDKIAVAAGDSVIKGQVISSGLVAQTVRVKGKQVDNTHLHWEMRYFPDASDIKSRSSSYTLSCSGAPGPGYTYSPDPNVSDRPDYFVANGGNGPVYRWTDPSDFVDAN